MTQLSLGDVNVATPDNCLVVNGKSRERRQKYRVTGPGVGRARQRIIEAATERRFVLRAGRNSLTLVRGHERITIQTVDDLEFTVVAYTTERIPPADPEEAGIALGRLWLALPEARIERVDEKARSPRYSDAPDCEWEVFGREVDAVMNLIVESLRAHGLHVRGLFDVKHGGVGDRWSCDAEGPNVGFKAYAVQEPDRVRLTCILFDSEPADEPGA